MSLSPPSTEPEHFSVEQGQEDESVVVPFVPTHEWVGRSVCVCVVCVCVCVCVLSVCVCVCVFEGCLHFRHTLTFPSLVPVRELVQQAAVRDGPPRAANPRAAGREAVPGKVSWSEKKKEDLL